jgi:hypothetical protein
VIGAILGDIVGSVHEHRGTKSTEFPLFVGVVAGCASALK